MANMTPAPNQGNCARSAFNESIHRKRYLKWLLIVPGFLALIWFFIRVFPKPSRAAYPCQRAAAPLASSFVAYILSLIATSFFFKRAGHYARSARFRLLGLCLISGAAAAYFSFSMFPAVSRADFVPEASNQPVGVAKGLFPGRVAWIYNPDSTLWGGATGFWWQDANTDQAQVDAMMDRALLLYTEETSVPASWDALFRYFNRTHGKGDVGYQAGEKIAIKINLNNAGAYNSQDNQVDTSPQVTLAILRQLVNQAGAAQSSITVYDAVRNIDNIIYNKCQPEFPNVSYVDATGTNGRTLAQWSNVQVHYADPTIPDQRLPQCVVDADYFINFAALKKHVIAGVTLIGKNLCGSIQGGPGNLHTDMDCRNRGMGVSNPLVDLIGHEQHGGKTLLYFVDGLYSAPDQGGNPWRWTAQPFNNDWPSSLFLSQDGVAIDSVAVDLLLSQAALYDYCDNYLHEAAQADSPPSGAVYDPEGDGTRLSSLGTHEHWNNSSDKQYSRNLCIGDGIELLWERMTSGNVPNVVTTLSLSCPSPLREGDTLTLTVSIENRSLTTADTNIRFTHHLSPGVSGFAMTSPPPVGTWNWNGGASPNGEITYDLARIDPGQSVQFQYTADVDITCATAPYRLCNVGFTTSDWILANEPGPRSSDSGDGLPSEPTGTPDITPIGRTMFAVTKSFVAPHNPVLEGDVVTYEISIANNSPVCAMVGGELTDDVPAGVAFSLASAGISITNDPGGNAGSVSQDPPAGAHGNGLLRVTNIDLPAGGSTFRVTYQVRANTATGPPGICNQASFSASGSSFSSNQVCYEVQSPPLPAAITRLKLRKQGGDVVLASWRDDPDAVSYSVYSVIADPIDKTMIANANAAGMSLFPSAIARICENVSLPPPACVHASGVSASPSCIFYQVVGVASNGLEGPN